MQQSKIDSIVNEIISRIAKRERGFVLDLAADSREQLESVRNFLMTAEASADQTAPDLVELRRQIGEAIDALQGTSIAVRELPPPVDEYVGPARGRCHQIADTDSFIAYCQRYGDPGKSLVFYNDLLVTLTIDEQIERGEREIVAMKFQPTQEYKAWSAIIAQPVDHKTLLRHLLLYSSTLETPEMLASMRSIKLNTRVDSESDIQDGAKTLGVVIKTTAGEEMLKFPKEINIRVPVLDQDLLQDGDDDQWRKATLRLDIDLPTDPMGGPKFTLHCSAWNTVLRERVAAEADHIRTELSGFTVIRGQSNEFTRSIGRDKS